MNDPMALAGQNIAALRKKQGLTQKELAELINITRTSIANIEAGRQSIHMRTIITLCDALGCTPNNLLRD